MFTAYIVTEQDEAESAAIWAAIDTEPVRVVEYAPHVETTKPVGEGLATGRAAIRGWAVDPALSAGNPHEVGGCPCKNRSASQDDAPPSEFCLCICHGRTFVHYKRNA